VCTHIEGYLQLKDMIIQITFKMLLRRIGKIIKRLGRLVKLGHDKTLGPEHDKIQAQWVSYILSESMLDRV
jgi:hypothetical protein